MYKILHTRQFPTEEDLGAFKEKISQVMAPTTDNPFGNPYVYELVIVCFNQAGMGWESVFERRRMH